MKKWFFLLSLFPLYTIAMQQAQSSLQQNSGSAQYPLATRFAILYNLQQSLDRDQQACCKSLSDNMETKNKITKEKETLLEQLNAGIVTMPQPLPTKEEVGEYIVNTFTGETNSIDTYLQQLDSRFNLKTALVTYLFHANKNPTASAQLLEQLTSNDFVSQVHQQLNIN